MREGKGRGVDKKVQTETEKGKKRMRDTQTDHTGPITSPSHSPAYTGSVTSPAAATAPKPMAREEEKKSKVPSPAMPTPPAPDAQFIPAYSGPTSRKASGAGTG